MARSCLIGLTGGVGMGKSATAACLAKLSVPVIDTDDLARELTAPGRAALTEIRQRFGSGVFTPDGRLDRAAMARLVFHDPAARRALEAILHPRIRAAWKRQAAELAARGEPIVAVAIPLLYETGAEREVDFVVCAACSEATRRARLRRRGWSEEEIEARVRAQWPVEEKMRRADWVIWTEGRMEVTRAQAEIVWSRLRRRIKGPGER